MMKLTTLAAIMATTALVPFTAVAQQQQQQQFGQQQVGQQNQQRMQQQGQQSQGVAASDLRNQTLYSQNGQEFGRVNTLVQDQNNRTFVVVSSGDRQMLVPADRLAYRDNRFTVTGSGNQLRFQAYNQQAASQYQELNPNYRLAIAGYDAGSTVAARQTGDGANIMVRQSAPTVQVDPADPRVIVRQQQPQVTVNQQQPEIIVRQPQPTVSVDIPQPEIIVRMPEPDVNVAMAQPQVQVRQPQPQVQIQQPQQQAQVQVERTQPQVQFQQTEGQPQVQVQRQGQPNVRYERAEPRVVVNQAQGQPQVRFERMDENQQAGAQNQMNQQAQATANQQAVTGQQQAQQQATAGSVYTEEQRRGAWERLRAGDVETTGAIDSNVQMRPLPIGDLEDMDVRNARGEELGEVDRVIVTPQGREFVVVAAGGFLGLGEDQVAFPLERFWMRGDELVIRGVTEEDIEAMDDYRNSVDNFQRLGRTDEAELRVWQ